jgi:transcriptional regulator with PAS, ATPase and Fis domain
VTRHIDVRLVAATNQDLRAALENGTFREDLYYRLNVVPLNIPPLRERKVDIPQLANHFVHKLATDAGCRVEGITEAAMEKLVNYHWPGNVRELENVIERMIALEASDVLTTKSLPEHVLLGGAIPDMTFELPPDGISLENHLEGIGKFFMLKALERSGGVQTQAAELLRMSFRSFRYYAKKYDLIAREARHEETVEAENEK